MIAKQKAREVISSWFALLNTNDVNAIDRALGDFFTEDYVLHFSAPADLQPGLAGLKSFFPKVLAENPNVKVTAEDLLVDVNRIAFRLTIQRTDPATGKPQHCAELCISRFVGEKIAEEWELLGSWEDDA